MFFKDLHTAGFSCIGRIFTSKRFCRGGRDAHHPLRKDFVGFTICRPRVLPQRLGWVRWARGNERVADLLVAFSHRNAFAPVRMLVDAQKAYSH